MDAFHTLVLVGMFLTGFGILGGCYLHDRVDQKKEAERQRQRQQQRLHDAAKEQETAMRVRKYNTMHAMRRTARRHRQEGRY
ncbi:hypothetical protein GCM10023084_54030 [Streptomyces lacrimifluminis]|uniref:Uncharacterized protein n=1 Tax=Streptomyces lacrimifluminis TaxID=1500077 RepID=A0A917KXB0_9ACTN|nr:hypothetical protein [Streptomyces lacrimifluminis]GGJ34327.1 hypothetical protein GCM10012282_33830 [Streptomyces lacrimifluminis]